LDGLAILNSQEQRLRHTAVTELRDEVGTVVDALLKTVGQQLEQERQAWTKAVEAIAHHVEQRMEAQGKYVDSQDDDLRALILKNLGSFERGILESVSDHLRPMCRPTIWGRLRWLVLGR